MQSVKTARGKTAIKSKPRDLTLWLRLLILGAILAAFGRIMSNEFVNWDDGVLIYGNPNINPPTWNGLARHWNPYDHSNIQMYDPLVFTTWWVIAHGAQLDPNSTDMLDASLNPYIFHIASLLVHWVTACVVMEILLRIGFGRWPAVAGAIIFAVHPIQTEAVAWATAMKDLLSGMFVMLAIWRYLAAMDFTGRRRWIHYGIATFFFLCALLSKPSTVITPLILVVLDIVVFHRAWRGVLARLSPWFLLALVATLLAESIQSTRPLTYTPIMYRPLIAADALAFYLSKLVLPIGLTWDYGRTPLAVLHDARLHHPLYWTWIFPAALALVIWSLKRPQLRAAGLVFLAGVLPVLGFTSFVFQYYSTVADRYVYVSMLGVAMAVAWIISGYGNRAVIGGFVAVVILLSCVSFTQAGYWRDHEALSTREEDLGVGNALHYIVLGQYKDRLAQVALKRGGYALAQGRTAEGEKLIKEGEADARSAIQAFRDAISINPLDTFTLGYIPVAYEHIRVELITLGHFQDAIDLTLHEIATQDQVPERARTKPEILHGELGMMYAQLGRLPDAAAEFRKSLSYKQDAEIENRLAKIEQQLQSASRPATNPAMLPGK